MLLTFWKVKHCKGEGGSTVGGPKAATCSSPNVHILGSRPSKSEIFVGPAEGGAPDCWAPRRVGGSKISRFFVPLPPQFSFFLPLLGVVSLNFGVNEGRDLKCARLEFSGCRVKPGRPKKTRHEQQIVPKNSPIGQVFWGQGWFSKVWAQNGLIKKRGQEAVWAKSGVGQKLCGPKVVRKNRKHGKNQKNQKKTVSPSPKSKNKMKKTQK